MGNKSSDLWETEQKMIDQIMTLNKEIKCTQIEGLVNEYKRYQPPDINVQYKIIFDFICLNNLHKSDVRLLLSVLLSVDSDILANDFRQTVIFEALINAFITFYPSTTINYIKSYEGSNGDLLDELVLIHGAEDSFFKIDTNLK